jgi:4-hydroxyacetophenone monooxygenase
MKARCAWGLRVRVGDREETLPTNALISAVGQLTDRACPTFPDASRSPGRHSIPPVAARARPRAKARVSDRPGTSAFQLVRDRWGGEPARRVQRSPPWMVPDPRYHARVSEAKQWLLRHVPYYTLVSLMLFWPGGRRRLMQTLVIDPDWPHHERAVNAVNDRMRAPSSTWPISSVAMRSCWPR